MVQQKLVFSEKTHKDDGIYQDEPELRFPEFKNDWKTQIFDENLSIKSGKGFKASEYVDEGIPILKIDNVGYNKIKWENKDFLPYNYRHEYPNLILKKEDIVLALNRPITNNQLKMAKLTSEDGECILYQRVGKIDVNESKLEKNFIYYLLYKEIFKFVLKTAIGSDQPFISTNKLKELRFSVPILNEQKKIANFLLVIDKKIELLEKKHQLFKDFKNYSMQQIFTSKLRCVEFDEKWVWLNFKDIFKTISTKKYQIKSSEINEKGLYEVVDQGQQDIAGYNDDNSKLFMKLPIIVYGDHTTFVKYRNSPFIVGADGVKLLSLAINADMKYMYYALDYFNIKPEGYKRHFSIIKKIDLPIPSLNEQKYISSFFSKLDDEINFLKLQIENTKRFKKGLLQKMFV